MSTEFLTNQNIKLNLIVAMCNSNLGIGINGEIPWRLPTDMKHFASVTTFTEDKKKINAVIMGRLTWLSIPKKFRPMPNRLNVIILKILLK
jgi:dihydrofolate reductase